MNQSVVPPSILNASCPKQKPGFGVSLTVGSRDRDWLVWLERGLARKILQIAGNPPLAIYLGNTPLTETNESGAFCCSLIGGKEIELDYPLPISFGIRRVEFDRYLLDRSGAERRLNESVEKIERHGDRWIVNDRYTAPMLVGAGGTHCPVSRMFETQRQTNYPTVVAKEIEFKIPDALSGTIRGEVPALYFCQDLLGYGWRFRKGDYLNIGIGRTDATDFMSHVNLFQEFLAKQGLPCKEVGHPWKGHSYQIYSRVPRRLFAEGVILLGDAAGLAYAQSGEGIRPAVESGLIAAKVIVGANGNYQSEHLAAYQSQLEDRRGKPQPSSLLNQLPSSWVNSLAAWMLASPWLSRRILMDQLFLHRSEEAFVF